VRILARGMWVDNNRLLEELHGAATAAVAKVRALDSGQFTIWFFLLELHGAAPAAVAEVRTRGSMSCFRISAVRKQNVP